MKIRHRTSRHGGVKGLVYYVDPATGVQEILKPFGVRAHDKEMYVFVHEPEARRAERAGLQVVDARTAWEWNRYEIARRNHGSIKSHLAHFPGRAKGDVGTPRYKIGPQPRRPDDPAG